MNEEFSLTEFPIDDNEELNYLLRMDNDLIQGMWAADLVTMKLFEISVANVEMMADGALRSVMKASDIKAALGYKGNSVYYILKDASLKEKDDYIVKKGTKGKNKKTSLLNMYLSYEDDEGETFHGMNVCTDVHYEKGVFTVDFNRNLKNKIFELKSNYTTTSLQELFDLKSSYSHRLYHILDTLYWRLNFKPEVTVVYEVAQLMGMLGTYDVQKRAIQRARKQGKSWNYIYDEIIPDHEKFNRDWPSFRKNVLLKAVEEINHGEKYKFTVEFEAIGRGVGNKIYKVKFTIRKRKTSTKQKNLNADQKIIQEFVKLIDGQALSKEECKRILLEANYDLLKIKRAIKVMKQQKENVYNPAGFIIRAIRESWTVEDKVDTGAELNELEEEEVDQFIRQYQNLSDDDKSNILETFRIEKEIEENQERMEHPRQMDLFSFMDFGESEEEEEIFDEPLQKEEKPEKKKKSVKLPFDVSKLGKEEKEEMLRELLNE